MKIRIPKNNNKHLIVIPIAEWNFWQLQEGDTIDIEIVGAWNQNGKPKRAMSTKG